MRQRFSFFRTVLLFVVLWSSTLLAQRTKHVVIMVLDGARYTETFGDSSHANVPLLWNTLRPLGTLFTSFHNDGTTWTNSSHASILSGTRESLVNDGSEPPQAPTMFEYFRRQTGAAKSECWVVLGKTKLLMLAQSNHADYGVPFGASVITSTSDYDDGATWENTKRVVTTYHPAITIVNLSGTDERAHEGDWNGYIGAIRRADTLIAATWKMIQGNAVLRGRTTMIVTNDHGRHTRDFADHGDQCKGCNRIMLLVLGPETMAGRVDTLMHPQVGIAPTVGALLGFSTPLSEGTVLQSVLDSNEIIPSH